MKSLKILKKATVFTAMIMLSMVSSVYALTFFGEDRGIFNQDGSPTGVLYTNSNIANTAFLSNLTGVGTETFESFPAGTSAPLALTFPGAGTATLTGGGSVDNEPGTGQNAISGTNWWRTGAGNDFAINFSNPVAAFGFYGIDVGDIGAQLTLTLLNGSTTAIDIPHTVEPGGPSSGQNGSVIFFGYIDASNPWTQATFTNPSSGDDFGFDNMIIGSTQQVTPPVPEPSTFILFGTGLAGVAFLRRRKNVK